MVIVICIYFRELHNNVIKGLCCLVFILATSYVNLVQFQYVSGFCKLNDWLVHVVISTGIESSSVSFFCK
jgi:hypothetical protein